MSDRNEPERKLGRRDFLKTGAAATLGISALSWSKESGANPSSPGGPKAPAAAPKPAPNGPGAPKIEKFGILGKTGIPISDISFGSGDTASPKLVRYAYRRGIRYFDTAESYPLGKPGLAEKAIGKALRGQRQEVVIATKTIASPTVKRGVLMRRLEKSLRNLQTDYVDIFFNHAVNNVARLENPEWYEFIALAKKQGKIRASGMSGHGGNLIQCLDKALDENLVDVILAAHNFGQDPAFYEHFTKNFDLVANQVDLPRVLAKAHQQGVGVIAMKTLMGGKLNDLSEYQGGGATFAQAAFRWVLQNPNVDGLIVSMNSKNAINEYVAASGSGVASRSDLNLLLAYAQKNGRTHCAHGCNVCESSCPDEVAISEVLRTRMYAEDYGLVDRARAEYAALERNASPCLTCRDLSCLGTCPGGLDIPNMTRFTATRLG